MFRWFDHSWAHSQPHQVNSSQALWEQMYENYAFAIRYNLSAFETAYAVSPHHSGIYPLKEDLFAAWSSIFLIRATSTESYPHQKPAYMRRGFVHSTSGIMVMPRQTCGIWSHTNREQDFTEDFTIRSKEVVRTIVYNPLLVFMTHWTNYGSDRVAIKLFKHVFNNILETTNLNFISLPPLKMAQKYFEIFPDDKEPLWTNVCDDKRHLAIWSLNSTYCQKFPKFIILGPQKTGKLNINSLFKVKINILNDF